MVNRMNYFGFLKFTTLGLTFFLSGCFSTSQSPSPIRLADYQDNRVDVYAYHPNLIKNLSRQIAYDNEYIRAHKEQMKVWMGE